MQRGKLKTSCEPAAPKSHDWENLTLPDRRPDIHSMGDAEWKQYRAGIVRILTNSGESDEIRQQAFAMLLEADRRLWTNNLANGKFRNIANPVCHVTGGDQVRREAV